MIITITALKCVVVIEGGSIHISTSPSPYPGDVGRHSNQMQINFELNNAHVCQHNVCFHIPSVLIKDMTEKIILGIPFIAMIYPFTADLDGVSTVKMGIPIKFQFASKFEIDVCHPSLNMLPAKIKHLNFLKQEVMYKKISEQISDKLLQ